MNLLGIREPHFYGTQTLLDLDESLRQLASELRVDLECRQTNSEGTLLDWLEQAPAVCDGIVLNPAGLTHTSRVLGEAVAASKVPTVEVHMSNIHAREEWQQISYVAPEAVGVLSGLGVESYLLGLRGLVTHLRKVRW